ncbi:helix-turn-helix domain-containing protein [Amycolatopsis sp., V23-08]|uniref:Helix-turn-helix domain-containing protein n=1 Tax=Amycolatopsis heterodermiae TaxID=3110235 RepID=A0ABU5RGH3_9PSEU|nr:helix-turn-helix domain-containing protein [Amycolatopsis sp., V23-08]MEA5365268.1 helix-turn-helix domain-containing protein [Amycolatopsis sp., V23-08]
MTPEDGAVPRGQEATTDSWWRARLSNLYGLFAISMMMFDGREAAEIMRLAATSVSSLSGCTTDATYLVDENGAAIPQDGAEKAHPGLAAAVGELGGQSGRIELADGQWRWCHALRGLGGLTGHLVVRAERPPSRDEVFLLNSLGQQTAAALASATLLKRERRQSVVLRELNDQLSTSVERLKQQTQVHDVLSTISASGAGEPGIAHALHQLTALPVAIEDRFGNLRAWGGPGRPDPYPKVGAPRREELLRHAATRPEPVRVKDRLVSLVRPRHEVLGVLALIDPARAAGADEVFALEYGSTVLALELSHQRSLAEAELRLRRDLVDDLIAGTDDGSAYARAEAIGHDLRRPHHVVVLRWSDDLAEDVVAEATGRAVTTLGLVSLVSRHTGAVVLLVAGRLDAPALFASVSESLGAEGAIGVGSRCDTPGRLPKSYEEAVRALDIRRGSQTSNGVTRFDQLGIYRILDTGQNHADVVEFVDEWLGKLLDYDTRRNAELVPTLARYLECGGSYGDTAAALMIHRSTLRYRLGRIREITELDLNDVDSRLNLHLATRVWQVLRGSP